MRKFSDTKKKANTVLSSESAASILKEWSIPQKTSINLNMTHGKQAQWFEGPAFGINWSVAPS